MRIDWSQIPEVAGMRPGTSRQWVAGEQVSLTRVVTEPDAVFDGSLHHHDNEQWLVMLNGELELTIDDDTFTARTGDLVIFQPGSSHGAVGVGPEGAEYYEWFAPARYDGLPGFVGRSPLIWDRKAS